MKFKFIIMALLTAITLSAQSEVKLTLNYQSSDSTWYLTEIQRIEGKKVSERVLPESGQTLKKDAFKQYVQNLVSTEQNRLTELKRAEKKVAENIAFLGSAVDSVCGAGTFNSFQNDVIKNKLQGPWSLVIRNGKPEPDVITVNINGDVMNSKDKTSNIVWKDADSFQLLKGIITVNLNFTLVEPDKYYAERTVNGETTKYTLKR